MTPLRIGLTGGIASGKSTLAAGFARRGVPIHSADAHAHALTAPGAPLLREIRKRFGDHLFTADGTLDRGALAKLVFADVVARHDLEGILHPPVRAALQEAMADADADYCIVEIPLLERSDVGTLVDRVLVTDLPEDLQLQRLMQRDQRDRTSAMRLLAAQPTRTERLAFADDIVDTSGGKGALGGIVERLDALYRDIALRGDPGRPGLRLPAH